MFVIGIDTSNYTTSLALADENRKIIYQARRLLSVRSGERGLRQSEALYQHVVNLPELIEAIPREFDFKADLAAVAVSVRPRPVEHSYMPVFRAGISQARSTGRLFDVPVYEVSHQENHIRAALYGCGRTDAAMHVPFLATHFSGGTSELLLVRKVPGGYQCDIIGKTLDLNAGQLIDRIGVAMGCDFPAGRAVEALAEKAEKKDCVIPSRTEGLNFHFAGHENKARRFLETGIPKEEVAFGLLRSIAKTLSKVCLRAREIYGIREVVFSGGVMSNGIIRAVIEKELQRKGIVLAFTDPLYATDNACGTALLGVETHMKAEGEP